ncbi:hypothetical protein KOY49_02980 [Candidatus Minimicrobia vallesae]|uniref:Ribonuclease n=1 Tax=Candidatus Minimicrobia vallesae TaxID=2841264 RepID=A0A8F1MAP9_9BACT|nr:hypothetical protein [Candidatus Minimicrobia vallesae]QWQ31143.1 hypothetical protein KOY49_02980 [Candidatus Minimicrobia vallesae]
MILGIDEVGRGAWAGPLVIGAVVLGGAEIEGLDDSKKLTKKRREFLDEEIREQASALSLGWVSVEELDEIGMSEALLSWRRGAQSKKFKRNVRKLVRSLMRLLSMGRSIFWRVRC